MLWIQDALAEFGRHMGVDGLAFGPGGLVELRLENGSVLTIEDQSSTAEELLIHLRRPVGYQAAGWLRNALRRCHAECHSPWPCQVALRGQGPDSQLLLLTRVGMRGFTPQALSQAIDHQLRWSESLRPMP